MRLFVGLAVVGCISFSCTGSHPSFESIPATSWSLAIQQDPLVCVTGTDGSSDAKSGLKVCLSSAASGETRVSVFGNPSKPVGCLRVTGESERLGYATGADSACRDSLEIIGEGNEASFHVGGSWKLGSASETSAGNATTDTSTTASATATTGNAVENLFKGMAEGVGAIHVQAYAESCEESCRGVPGYLLIRFSKEFGVQFVRQTPGSCGLLGARGEPRKPAPSASTTSQASSAPPPPSSAMSATSSTAPSSASSSAPPLVSTTSGASTTSGG